MSSTNSVERVVVIGAGLGGLRTVESLRRRGYAGDIVLLGAELHEPYDRPPLSKQVLRGERDESSLVSADTLAELDVSLRLGVHATGLSVADSAVRTSAGEVGYDVAVIATGARPRRIPGLDGLVLRTIDDAHALRGALQPGERLVIIGAGLVGCEVAASARAMGVEVALVDELDVPASRVLGPVAGRMLAELHSRQGVELYLGVGVGVAGAEPGRVTLANGDQLKADVLLEAIGCAPDIGWLSGSDVALADGVVCDSDGRAAANLFAVGDVACWNGRRQEHWTNVGRQAEHVASVILGQLRPPPEVEYWWSDQYDIKLQGLGHPSAGDDVEVLIWGPRGRSVAVFSRAGRLTGLVGFSAAAAIMGMRAQVAAGADVAEVRQRLGS